MQAEAFLVTGRSNFSPLKHCQARNTALLIHSRNEGAQGLIPAAKEGQLHTKSETLNKQKPISI